jgi:hypothetical protein
VVDQNVIADNGGLTDYDTDAVIDYKSFSYHRAGVNFNRGHELSVV